MTDMPEPDRKFEQWFDALCSGLPSRQAPAALQAQVLEELALRARRGWWRRSFTHWPPAARIAFACLCTGLIGLLLGGDDWTALALRAWHDSTAWSLPSAGRTLTLLSVGADLLTVLSHAIPASWLHAALAAGGALYAALFALGAAAYRTLYLTSPHAR